MNLATGYSRRKRREEGIERFIEGEAFRGGMVRLITQSPITIPRHRQQLVSLSQSSCVSPVELTYGGRGWARSRIIRLREAWPSSNHSSILSELVPVMRLFNKDDTERRLHSCKVVARFHQHDTSIIFRLSTTTPEKWKDHNFFHTHSDILQEA
jgi:hypothetical protein